MCVWEGEEVSDRRTCKLDELHLQWSQRSLVQQETWRTPAPEPPLAQGDPDEAWPQTHTVPGERGWGQMNLPRLYLAAGRLPSTQRHAPTLIPRLMSKMKCNVCTKYAIKEATNIQFTDKGLSDLQPGATYTTAINATML